MTSIYFVICVILFQSCGAFVVLQENGYKGLQVFVSPSVPRWEWEGLSSGLMDAFKKTSDIMYFATGNRAYFSEYTVIVPREWNDLSYLEGYKQTNDLESEMTIHSPEESISLYNEFPYVENARVCLANGDMMHFSSNFFTGDNNFGPVEKLMLKTWMTYRYGLFDELGYPQDTKYPAVYCDANGVRTATQCSNVPLVDSQETFFSISGKDGDCSCTDHTTYLPNCFYVPSSIEQNEMLYSSIMGFHHMDKMQTFCDTDSEVFIHDRTAPNLQNHFCNNQTIMDTMLQHYDFSHGHNSPDFIEDRSPTVSVYQQRTKIVFLLDTNGHIKPSIGSMVKSMVSEWIDQFAMFMHVGVVAINNEYHDFEDIFWIQQLDDPFLVEDIKTSIEYIEYNGHEKWKNRIEYGLQRSLDMVQDHDGIIVLISDGWESGISGDFLNCCQDQIKSNSINIVAIDMGQDSHNSERLKQLSQVAGNAQGMYFHAGDSPVLVRNALATVARTFSYPNPSDPTGKNKIYSSMNSHGHFWIDSSLSQAEIVFHVLTYDVMLFHDGKPQDLDYSQYPKVVKYIEDVEQDSATGKWEYFVSNSPFSAVHVTGISNALFEVIHVDCQVLRTKVNGQLFQTRIVAKPLLGNKAIINASVNATLTRGDGNPIPVIMYDDGFNGMDAIKDDGVYTALVPGDIEEGTTVQCVVEGSQNTFAHSGFDQWYEEFHGNVKHPLCCGSTVPNLNTDPPMEIFTRMSVANYYIRS